MPRTTRESHADDDEEPDNVTVTTPRPAGLGATTVERGSVVVVRDQEWLVRATEPTTDGQLVRVQGLGDLVHDTDAVILGSIDATTALTPRTQRSSPTAACITAGVRFEGRSLHD